MLCSSTSWRRMLCSSASWRGRFDVSMSLHDDATKKTKSMPRRNGSLEPLIIGFQFHIQHPTHTNSQAQAHRLKHSGGERACQQVLRAKHLLTI